jgi:hypothetical protein
MNTQTIPGTDFPFPIFEHKGKPELLTSREAKQRLGLLAKVHIARDQMPLNDGEYEMLVRAAWQSTGSETPAPVYLDKKKGLTWTAKYLTLHQLENMVKMLKHFGWKEISRRKTGINPEQIIALRGRCIQAAREIQNGDKRLVGLAEKICGTSQLVWCNSVPKLERLLAVLGKIKMEDKSHG